MNTIMSFCWFGIISFLPIYLIEGKGINEATAGIIFSLLFATGFFLKPFIGHLSDHYSKKILMITLLFIAALSCFLLTQAKTVYMSALGVIMAASVSALFPLRSAYLLNKWPSRSRGSRTGMFATIVIMLSSLSPVIVGYGAEQIGFNTIFLIFSFIIFITATIVASVKFIYPSIKNKRNTAIND